MALYDAADLLARFKRYARRPATDEAWPDASIYALLTEAQIHQVGVLASHVPQAMYSAPELMTTADSGATYTIPSVVTAGTIPLAVTIRIGRAGRVLIPGEEWDANADFCVDADGKIRIPNGRTRQFGAGLYARYVLEPGIIDASHEPTLKPASARTLIVFDALERWASVPGVEQDPSFYSRLYNNEAWGDSEKSGDIGVIARLKLQYTQSGERTVGAAWWRAIDPGWTL